MAAQKRATPTRERILETSLAMFNAFGEPNVTTNHIADEAGISPGNLYYHFRSKGDIVERLFDAYESGIDETLLLPSSRKPDLEDLWLQLHLLFETIVRHRFLYRDLVDILSRHRRIRLRFARLLQRARDNATTLLHALIEDGTMRATPTQVRMLVENLLLQATFWLGYEMVRDGSQDMHVADAGRGIRHMLALLVPYLDEGGRAHLSALGASYRD